MHRGRPLTADDRLCGLRRRDRIGVPVHKSPDSVLPPVDAGHTEADRNRTVAAADLRPEALDLGQARESVCYVRRHTFEPHNLAVPVARGG